MKKSSFSLLLISFFFLFPTFIFAQETGKASYYNDKFQGNPTASGEPYDKNKFTAAHRTLPFGAIVRVTNLKNQKAVTVRINDMGPHNLSRIIDLSGAAADAIDMKTDGVVDVKMDVIAEYPDENTSKIGLGPTSGGQVAAQPTSSTATNMRRGQSAPSVVYPTTSSGSASTTSSSLALPNIKPGQAPGVLSQPANRVAASGTVTTSGGANQRVMRSSPATPVDTKGSGLFKFVAYKTQADGYGIQLGVYADYRTVLEQTNQLMLADIQDIMIHAHKEGEKDLFRMIVGPFPSRGAAETYKKQLTSIGKEGFIVVLQDLN